MSLPVPLILPSEAALRRKTAVTSFSAVKHVGRMIITFPCLLFKDYSLALQLTARIVRTHLKNFSEKNLEVKWQSVKDRKYSPRNNI